MKKLLLALILLPMGVAAADETFVPPNPPIMIGNEAIEWTADGQPIYPSNAGTITIQFHLQVLEQAQMQGAGQQPVDTGGESPKTTWSLGHYIWYLFFGEYP